MTKKWVACTAAAMSLLISACYVDDGLGDKCLLVKKDPSDPTGKRALTIKESEIQALGNVDIISWGATECENMVCVRASNTPFSATPTTTDAVGFCSRACAENNPEACLTHDPSIDNNDPFECRALALDPEELIRITQEHPELIPPGVTSPFYCAKPLIYTNN